MCKQCDESTAISDIRLSCLRGIAKTLDIICNDATTVAQKLFLLGMNNYESFIPDNLIKEVLEIRGYVQCDIDLILDQNKIIHLEHVVADPVPQEENKLWA